MSDEQTPESKPQARRGRRPYPRFSVTVPHDAACTVVVAATDAVAAIERAKKLAARGRLPQPSVAPVFENASAERV